MFEPEPHSVFRDAEINVDGSTWFYNGFIGCRLIRNDPDTKLWCAHYVGCEFVGDGWPSWVKELSVDLGDKHLRGAASKLEL
jgi:hypothetical protein